MQTSPTSGVSEDVVIYDMSETIRKLIKEANKDKYRPGCKSYELFDDDDADCYGVNQDKHHDVSRESIENYIWLIYKNAQMEQECLIPSMMYLQKILDSHHTSFASKLRMYSKNWKTIVGMSMLIAAKVWDDFHMDVASVVTFMYCMTLQRCNKLEILCLKMIDFDVSVKRIAFCDYEEDIKRNMSQRLVLTNTKDEQNSTLDHSEDSTVVISSCFSSPTLGSSCTDIDDSSGCCDYEVPFDVHEHRNEKFVKFSKSCGPKPKHFRSNKVHVDVNGPHSCIKESNLTSQGVVAKISGVVRTLLPFMASNSVKIG
jgi:hypothetical protein